jgi:hypothetical protein
MLDLDLSLALDRYLDFVLDFSGERRLRGTSATGFRRIENGHDAYDRSIARLVVNLDTKTARRRVPHHRVRRRLRWWAAPAMAIRPAACALRGEMPLSQRLLRAIFKLYR